MNRLKLFFIFLLLVEAVIAQNIDAEAFESLKKEAEFNIKRRTDFKNQTKKNQIFDREREKGMAFYLEEQERWEYLREKAVPEQRKLRRQMRSMDESGPEYRKDQREKQKLAEQQEEYRKNYVRIRNQFSKKIQSSKVTSEEEEYGLIQSASRPRYSAEKRQRNKWTITGKASMPSGGVGGVGRGSARPSYNPPSGDYVPPEPDYSAYPTDNFEELPPPPPLPYEGEFGDGYPNPEFIDNGEFGFPPPPPAMNDGEWDF